MRFVVFSFLKICLLCQIYFVNSFSLSALYSANSAHFLCFKTWKVRTFWHLKHRKCSLSMFQTPTILNRLTLDLLLADCLLDTTWFPEGFPTAQYSHPGLHSRGSSLAFHKTAQGHFSTAVEACRCYRHCRWPRQLLYVPVHRLKTPII